MRHPPKEPPPRRGGRHKPGRGAGDRPEISRQALLEPKVLGLQRREDNMDQLMGHDPVLRDIAVGRVRSHRDAGRGGEIPPGRTVGLVAGSRRPHGCSKSDLVTYRLGSPNQTARSVRLRNRPRRKRVSGDNFRTERFARDRNLSGAAKASPKRALTCRHSRHTPIAPTMGIAASIAPMRAKYKTPSKRRRITSLLYLLRRSGFPPNRIHSPVPDKDTGSFEGGRQIWLVHACAVGAPWMSLRSLRPPFGKVAASATLPS